MADRITSRSETAYLPPAPPPSNHGSTVAAWFTTVATITGWSVGALGVVLALPWVLWTGIAISLLGLVIGKLLQMMGWGKDGDKTRARERRRREQGRGH